MKPRLFRPVTHGLNMIFIILFIYFVPHLGLLFSSGVLTAHSLDYNRQELLPGGLCLRAEVALQFAGDGDCDAVCQQLRTKQQQQQQQQQHQIYNDKTC